MESGQHEDSKNSSEEINQPEQANDDTAGTGRSYECVFCKRGFTTAQALGGHMNIHRKDRARTTTSKPAPSKLQEDYDANPRFQFLPDHLPSHHASLHYSAAAFGHQSQKNHHQMYFPASTPQGTSSIIPHACHGRTDHGPASLQYHTIPTHAEDSDEKRQGISGEQEEELDLELRLGHDPY